MAKVSTPRGVRNNNPLNIRKSNDVFTGEICDIYEKEFKVFKSALYGFRAAFRILQTYILYKGCNTPTKIVGRWCPDGTAKRYCEFVCSKCGFPADKALSFSDKISLVALVQAMAQYETGHVYGIDLISKAYDLCVHS